MVGEGTVELAGEVCIGRSLIIPTGGQQHMVQRPHTLRPLGGGLAATGRGA